MKFMIIPWLFLDVVDALSLLGLKSTHVFNAGDHLRGKNCTNSREYTRSCLAIHAFFEASMPSTYPSVKSYIRTSGITG